MNWNKNFGLIAAGFCAGAVNGLFGAGGGMILIPLLSLWTDLEDRQIFTGSTAVILPISLISLTMTARLSEIPWNTSLPYLLSGTFGGLLAARFGNRIPTVWLHRCLGGLILWGGIRYLC